MSDFIKLNVYVGLIAGSEFRFDSHFPREEDSKTYSECANAKRQTSTGRVFTNSLKVNLC